MKIAITGHTNIEKANGTNRPDGRRYEDKVFHEVFQEIEEMIEKVLNKLDVNIKNLTLISGMARGIDEIFALYAIRHDLPLIAAIPYRKNWHRANKNSAIHYDEILDYIEKRDNSFYKEIEKGYNGTPNAFFARNQYMVDICDGMLSYMKYRSTGTIDAITRAKKDKKYLGNVTDFVI